jgi:hypothetical protein
VAGPSELHAFWAEKYHRERERYTQMHARTHTHTHTHTNTYTHTHTHTHANTPLWQDACPLTWARSVKSTSACSERGKVGLFQRKVGLFQRKVGLFLGACSERGRAHCPRENRPKRPIKGAFIILYCLLELIEMLISYYNINCLYHIILYYIIRRLRHALGLSYV